MDASEKHKKDVELLTAAYRREENPLYKKHMEDNLHKYLAAPEGILYS